MGEKALLRACREMLRAERKNELDDAEIVGTPAEYWLGDRRVSTLTVELGLFALLFRSEGIGTEFERHTLNELGREYAETASIPTLRRIAEDRTP